MDSSHLSTTSEPTVGRIMCVALNPHASSLTIMLIVTISVAEKIAPEVLVMLHAALEYYFNVTTSIDLYVGYKKLGKQVQYEEMVRCPPHTQLLSLKDSRYETLSTEAGIIQSTFYTYCPIPNASN